MSPYERTFFLKKAHAGAAFRHGARHTGGMPSKTVADLFMDDVVDQVTARVLARLDVRPPQAAAPAGPDTLRVEEAAELIRLSPRELRRRIASGELRSIKMGRVRLIPRAALSEFLERYERPGGD
jgi:excisionase family DNA binding protein